MSNGTVLKRHATSPTVDSPRTKLLKKAASTSSIPPQDIDKWDRTIDNWYPNLAKECYFVPPEYMNTVQNKCETISGVTVSIPEPPSNVTPEGRKGFLQESTARKDRTQQMVMHCFKRLANTLSKPMLVVQELQYDNYLRDVPDKQLPKPKDLQQYSRGDFDLLVIHPDYGVIVGEIKTVGDLSQNQTDKKANLNVMISNRGTKGLKQLNKHEQVLKHLFSDLAEPPKITTVLILPNVSRAQLQNAINNCQSLWKAANTRSPADPLDICLCADDLDSPHENPKEPLKNLLEWWNNTIVSTGEKMPEGLYRELVRRFAGPATIQNNELHTVSQAVFRTGEEFSKITLTPEQKKIIQSDDPHVFITGPPGTGKTLALTLKGKIWSCLPDGVHLLSTWSGSLAATIMIEREIKKMNTDAKTSSFAIRRHHFVLKEEGQIEKAVETMAAVASKSKKLRVIVDELFVGGSEFEDFCTKLLEQVPELQLWCASIYHRFKPNGFKKITFLEPLRTPDAVSYHVQQSTLVKDGFVPAYKNRTTPSPTWGQIIYIRHEGPAHSRLWPAACEECGILLAKELKDLVHTDEGGDCEDKPLQFRDVFILTIATSYDGLQDEKLDEEGNEETPASGMVLGLRSQGVPVCIVEAGDVTALEHVVNGTGPNAVIAADSETIRGLERKVVVWLQADKQDTGEEDFGRLDAMSRTNSLLIVVS